MEQKKFSFWSIVFLGINSIIGAGIFITPGKAYAQLGINSLYILLMCAVIATIMGLCFAEMAGMFSETGGPYIYVRETYGKFWGFQVGFIRFIVGCLAWGTNMIAVPTALAAISPSFNSIFSSDIGKGVTAVIFIVLITIVNLRGVRSSEIFNNVLTIIKFLPLLLLVLVVGFYIKGANLATPPTDVVPAFSFKALGAGFLLLVYSFYGFENIGVAAQDMENPTKNIPRAIFAVMIILTVIYFFIYLNTIGILGQSLASGEPAKAPIATAMAVIFGDWVRNVIVAVSVVSMVGFSLATAFSSARNIIPLAKDHFFPESVGQNNQNGVPGKSIVLVMIVTIIVVLISIFASKETFVFLVAVSGIGRFLQYIPVSISVLKARKLGIPGSFRLAFAGIFVPISIIVSIICMVYGIMKNLNILWFGVLPLVVLSIIVWFFYSAPRAKQHAGSAN